MRINNYSRTIWYQIKKKKKHTVQEFFKNYENVMGVLLWRMPFYLKSMINYRIRKTILCVHTLYTQIVRVCKKYYRHFNINILEVVKIELHLLTLY